MPSFILNLHFKEFLLNLPQAPCHQLHFFFVPNQCCGQHFFMTNCCIFHFLHRSNECAVYNRKVLLQSLQSLPCFPFLLLSLFHLLLSLMEFFIQLYLSKHKTCIILLPFLFVGFKLKGVNMMLDALLLIQYYAL